MSKSIDMDEFKKEMKKLKQEIKANVKSSVKNGHIYYASDSDFSDVDIDDLNIDIDDSVNEHDFKNGDKRKGKHKHSSRDFEEYMSEFEDRMHSFKDRMNDFAKKTENMDSFQWDSKEFSTHMDGLSDILSDLGPNIQSFVNSVLNEILVDHYPDKKTMNKMKKDSASFTSEHDGSMFAEMNRINELFQNAASDKKYKDKY